MKRRKNKITKEQFNELGIISTDTIDDALELVIKDCKIKNLRQNTIKFYENEIKATKNMLLEQKKSIRLHDISEKVIRINIIEYMNDNERKINAINARLRALRRVFNLLEQDGLIFDNPMENIKLVKTDKRIQPTLTLSQIKDLLSQPDQTTYTGYRNFCIILLFLETGIRLNELINLKMEDIMWEDNLIKVSHPKNRIQRVVPIQKMMKQRLKGYIKLRGHQESDILFLNIDNKPLSNRKIQEWIADYARNAKITNIKCSPHIFRYTFVKFAVKSEVNLFVLQEILGHKSLEMVRHYYTVFGNDIVKEHKKFSIAQKIFTK
ncbi:Tyrosine recombinase XerC [Streptomyces afghaniensis]